MSICIKHGLVTKHRYKKGLCLNCGRVRAGKKENISVASDTLAEGQHEPEQLQTTENSWDSYYEKHSDNEHDDFPSDFQEGELDRP